ncbi:MAG: FAD-binding protein [Clostridia bacterium]|nr:FAD-binding protein [Clostridia bacterium]
MIKTYKTSCLVIGSGCAGFNGADWLYDLGLTDVILATEGIKMGTSRNTGSDKQTYYKMSLSHDCVDGVGKMAESYFKGGAMSGELALTESANSLSCFFKLCTLGVPFPKNEYGEFVGYQTDHDDTKRATSVGPLTSKYMTEALERSVLSKNIKILDCTLAFKLFEKNGKICGALAYDKAHKEFILVETPAIILATGGSAYLYRDSVFPLSQSGMSGLAIEIGAKTANLTEWQYGLASTDFRWNVSGTYQQVLPRYISVDDDGNEYEFLYDSLTNEEVLLYTFRKGYQWPFDSRKKDASSMVDILVHKEILKGRKVYMDFMENPKGFSFDALPEEAYTYLKNSDAMQEKPIDRLISMNEKAYKLYLDHNIDLKTEMLRVAVCAQHQNGGLMVDKNYQTSVDGLYAAGEVAGVFGVYRPGGSALNSTQVSSMRSAMHIAKSKREQICDLKQEAEEFVASLKFTSKEPDFEEKQAYLQQKMSDFAAFSRDLNEIESMKAEVGELIKNAIEIPENKVFAFLKYKDMLITMHEVLCAMELWCKRIGARGSAMTIGCETDGDNSLVICTRNGRAYSEKPSAIPESEVWFEKVYNSKEG